LQSDLTQIINHIVKKIDFREIHAMHAKASMGASKRSLSLFWGSRSILLVRGYSSINAMLAHFATSAAVAVVPDQQATSRPFCQHAPLPERCLQAISVPA